MRQKVKYLTRLLPFWILFVSFFGYSFMKSNSQSEDLLKIRRMYKQLFERAMALDKNTIFYLNCKITMLPNGINATPQKTKIEFYSGKQKNIVFSDRIETFSDNKSVVSIIPDLKKIFIYNGIVSSEKTQNNVFKSQMLTQDSLLKLCEVESIMTSNDKHFKTLKLKVSEKGIKAFHVVSIVFLIDQITDCIKEISYNYDHKSSIKKMEMQILEYNFDYKTTKLDRPALAEVINADNKVIDKYKNYEIIDNRVKKDLTNAQKKMAMDRIRMTLGKKNKQ